MGCISSNTKNVGDFNVQLECWRFSPTIQLSKAFIIKFVDELDWYSISQYQTLSEPFIRLFAHKVWWFGISEYQTLSEDFMREFADKLDWWRISQYQTLSEDFIREFSHKLNWCRLSECQTLSEDLIREFSHKLNWCRLSECQKEWFRHSVYRIDLSGDRSEICRCRCHPQPLSESFITEFYDKINFFYYFQSNHIDIYSIRRYKDELTSIIDSTVDKKSFGYNYMMQNVSKCIKNGHRMIAFDLGKRLPDVLNDHISSYL